MNTFKTKKGTELPILELKGKDYLQVAHRLVWFREECPRHRIETHFVTLAEKYAIAQAIIKNEAGEIMATAHKREDAGHFGDFIEKAETGAIGRALAYCGFGTQFCADELDEGSRLADAPTVPKKTILSIKPATTNAQAIEESSQAKASPPPASAWENLTAYRLPFGRKHKGKTFDEMGLETVLECVESLLAKEKLTAQESEFLALADQWLTEKKSST